MCRGSKQLKIDPIKAMKIGAGVESAANNGSHLSGIGYEGADPSTSTDFGGEGGKFGLCSSLRPLVITARPAPVTSFNCTKGSTIGSGFAVGFVFFFKGDFTKLQRTLQSAIGISTCCTFVCDVWRGGSGGGFSVLGAKLGAPGTKNPDCLNTMVGCVST